jgi:hypothetical protein
LLCEATTHCISVVLFKKRTKNVGPAELQRVASVNESRARLQGIVLVSFFKKRRDFREAEQRFLLLFLEKEGYH